MRQPRVELQPLQRERQRTRRYVRRLVDAVGDRTARDVVERLRARIVDVDNRRCVRRRHLEQPALGREVLLHVRVEVEMVAGQVGEGARGELNPVGAPQRQGVRRHFHHARAAPFVTIRRMKDCSSGASGVVRVASIERAPMRYITVPIIPHRTPAASRIAAVR